MSTRPRIRNNGTPTTAFFISDDEIRDEHRRRSLMAEAQQTGLVRRRAVEALRNEYQLIYWERNGKTIVGREN